MNNPPQQRLGNAACEPDLSVHEIPFNRPFNNRLNFQEVIPTTFDCSSLFHGPNARLTHQYLKDIYQAQEVVLTASCTNALELASLLLDLKRGDEVIIPAYTYVSTANAFELRGAKLVLCDSATASPNIDLNKLEALITPKTKAIVVIHYGGICVNMYRLQEIARRHGVVLIEDAAHAVDAWYDGQRLGTFGDLATFSFHETKNITCGQGGALLINNERLVSRAWVLRDCGTNRQNYQLGLVDKYTWIDVGSVYNLSELNCAYLYPQLRQMEMITEKRVQLWENYYRQLQTLQDAGHFKLPFVSDLSRHNAHIFYMVLDSKTERDRLLRYLKTRGVVATFHYSGLHQCPYFQKKYPKLELANAEKFAGRLLRLPLFYDLEFSQQDYILECIREFYQPCKNQNLIRKVQNLASLPMISTLLESNLFGTIIDVLG